MQKTNWSKKEFLSQCSKSSNEAYEAIKSLLAGLEQSASHLEQPAPLAPSTSQKNASPSEAICFLQNLYSELISEFTVEQMMQKYHFSFFELKLKGLDLKLLHLPSTFVPEEWSFTFYEGLSRYKAAEFEDRKVVELGCGIGWISIALAIQNQAQKVYGLDINPRAITCARINLFLNAFDQTGHACHKINGKALIETVDFQVSDLFSYCRGHNIKVDRVIGCIPQVLNPDPEFTAKMLKEGVSENASDEFLQSLSNYAPQQGQIEDQFGLGLIAKAVEDSVFVLKSTGKIILNLGGRPGKKVLQQLFLRRGFYVKQVWQTRVNQAKDTDIRALVEIEKNTKHRFEFYLSKGSDTPICAHTALNYAEAGGDISHALLVFEAQLRDPAHLPQILKTLAKPGYERARNAIDLNYSENSLVEEKASFLSALATELERTEFFPYQKTSGFEIFRKNLANYFTSYFRIYFKKENFVITPSCLVTCRNILSIYRPKKILIDTQIAMQLKANCVEFANGGSRELIEIPQGSDLLCEMMLKLKPDFVIYTIADLEVRSTDAFLRIVELSKKIHCRVLIDISDVFELNSAPTQNGIFRYIESNILPENIILMCGLVKNKIYSDLQVCFVISENHEFVTQLTNAAELTYSRTPFLSQFYYNCILNDLLSFHVFEETRTAKVAEGPFERLRKSLANSDIVTNPNSVNKPLTGYENSFIRISSEAARAFDHAAIVGERALQENNQLLRLDYGENCLPAPDLVKHVLMEAFAHQDIPDEDCNSIREILKINQMRWSMRDTSKWSCLLSGGVAPIFSEIAEHCARNNELMIFPCGSYGYFMASAEFHGAKVEKVNTNETRGFKIDPQHLRSLLKTTTSNLRSTTPKKAWVILSAPIVNPTGAIYNSDELKEIADIVKAHNAILVLDSIFSGLGFEDDAELLQADILNDCRILILGGLSKEFASGGLRVGYALSPDSDLVDLIRACELTAPHKTLKFALKKLYQSTEIMAQALQDQRDILQQRAKALTQVLKACGWRVLDSHGGLFLIATPVGWLGRKVAGQIIQIENLAQLLREHSQVVINAPDWIGLPNYFRFVLSVSEAEFTAALKAIEAFSQSIEASV